MRAWFAVVLLLGCSKKEDKPAPTPQLEVKAIADATAGTGDCATRAARIERELRELAAAKPGFSPLVQDINAPSASGAQPIKERGWVIAVGRDGSIFIQGHRFEKTAHTSVVEDVRSFTEQAFRSALEKFIMAGGSSQDLLVPLYIWADRDAPARVIAELVMYADPEGPWPPRPKGKPSADDPPPPPEDEPPPPEPEDRKAAIEAAKQAGILGGKQTKRAPRAPMRLLVSAEGAAVQPAAPASPKLPASEPESTQELVKQLRASIGDCPAIITTLATASLEGLPAKEAEKLVKDVPAGLVQCGCNVADADALEQGMRAWFGASTPPLAWIAMPKLDVKDKRTIGQVLKPATK